MQLSKHLHLLVVVGSLMSCDSAPDQQVSSIMLDSPFRDRQILNIGDNPFRIELSVNGGSVQNFVLAAGQPNIVVEVTGVRLNESNSIDVKWLEVLNGFDVELTEQFQTFIATGNVTIDAQHQSEQFDYDADGSSNFSERAAGTCVWSAIDTCLNVGQIDAPSDSVATTDSGIPESSDLGDQDFPGLSDLEQSFDLVIPQPFVFDYDNAQNILQNREIDEWYTFDAVLQEQASGIVCVVFPMGPVPLSLLLLAGPDVTIDPGRYSAEFDVMTTRETVVGFTLPSLTNNFLPIIEQHVYVTQQWRTIRIPFEHSTERDFAEYGFFALINPMETTYCFDNFRLYKEQ